MASLPSKRIRKVVNYAALDQDTDISDEDEFAGFSTSPKIKVKKSKSPAASPSCDKVSTTRGKLQNKASSKSDNLIGNGASTCSEEDDALQSSSESAPGRSSLQDRIFQRDLAAAVELSKKTLGPGSDHVMSEVSSPPLSTSTPKEALNGDGRKDVLQELTSKEISSANPRNSDEETGQSNSNQISSSSVNKKNMEEKENISLDAKSVLTRKELREELNPVDSDDDFSAMTTTKCLSKNTESITSPAKDRSNGSCKRRIDAIQKEVEVLATSRSKRACQKVSFAPDSSSDSENEWAESEEEDVDDLSEGSDYEETSPKIKKSMKEAKPSSNATAKKSQCKTVISKDVKPSSKSTKPVQDPNLISINTPVTSSGEALTLNNKTPVESTTSRSRNENSTKDKIRVTPITSTASRAPSVAVPSVSKTASSIPKPTRSTSTISEAPAIAVPGVSTTTCSVPKVTSPSPRPGMARAAFRSPAIAAVPRCPNSLAKAAAPSVGLRLGLSRKVSVKSLHPNASLK